MRRLPSWPLQNWFLGCGVAGGGRFGEENSLGLFLNLVPLTQPLLCVRSQSPGCWLHGEGTPLQTSCQVPFLLHPAAEGSGSESSAKEMTICSWMPARWGPLLFLLRYEPVLIHVQPSLFQAGFLSSYIASKILS